MERVYQGRYYAGSGKPNVSVSITLETGGIVIQTNPESTILWPYNEIQHHFANDHQRVYLSHIGTHLEIEGQGFYDEIIKRTGIPSGTRRRLSGYHWASIVLALILLAAMLWIYAMPVLSSYIAMRIPEKVEIQVGDAIWQQISAQEEFDSLRSGLAQQYLNELLGDSVESTRIYVAKSSIVNAFALPGHRIVVYTGLLERLKNHSEFAALLGHEYGHIAHRHVWRGMIQSVSTFALLSFFMGDLTGLAGILVEQGNMIFNLRFSRSYESESDQFSRELIEKRRIEPGGMKALFDHLQEGTDSLATVPEFLSTHPGIGRRIQNYEKWAAGVHYTPEENKVLSTIFSQLCPDLKQHVR